MLDDTAANSFILGVPDCGSYGSSPTIYSIFSAYSQMYLFIIVLIYFMLTPYICRFVSMYPCLLLRSPQTQLFLVELNYQTATQSSYL